MELRSCEGADENKWKQRRMDFIQSRPDAAMAAEMKRQCSKGRRQSSRVILPTLFPWLPAECTLASSDATFQGPCVPRQSFASTPRTRPLCELAHETEEEWEPGCLVSTHGHVSCLPPREENPSSCCSYNRRNLGAANSGVRGHSGTCPFWSLMGNLELLSSTCSVHVLYQKWVFGERCVRVSDKNTWSERRSTGWDHANTL